MPFFTYKAADPSGKVVKHSMEATDEKQVVAKLQDMGCIPIRIHAAGRHKTGFDITWPTKIRFCFKRVSTRDVMQFTQDLAALLEAGLPLDRTLSILTDVVENDNFSEMIGDILKSVQAGSDFSDALGRYPRVFSDFYVNMIRAGEAGGVLGAVLERLSIFLQSSQELKEYITSALVYPLFLVGVGGLSIIVLMTFVIPKFSIIFADMGQAVPASTRFLLAISALLRAYWWILAGLGPALYLLFVRYVRTPAGRVSFDRFKLRLPLMGELIKKIEVARFSRTLGTMIKSGVPILDALLLVKDIIGNQIIAESLMGIHERVKKGEKLSQPMSNSNIFPSLAVQMITVGEETGRLDEMLLRVADNYEKVVRNIVKRLISFMEPAMILLMGLVVGFIVISMLMAVFSMNDMPF